METKVNDYPDRMFNRPFKLWYYTVSHQQLLLRSPGKDGDYNVDIYFYAVEYVEIPWNINTLQIIETTQEDIDYINNKIGKTNEKITVLMSNNQKYYVVSHVMKIYKNNLSMFEVPFDIPNDMGGFHTNHTKIED